MEPEDAAAFLCMQTQRWGRSPEPQAFPGLMTISILAHGLPGFASTCKLGQFLHYLRDF